MYTKKFCIVQVVDVIWLVSLLLVHFSCSPRTSNASFGIHFCASLQSFWWGCRTLIKLEKLGKILSKIHSNPLLLSSLHNVLCSSSEFSVCECITVRHSMCWFCKNFSSSESWEWITHSEGFPFGSGERWASHMRRRWRAHDESGTQSTKFMMCYARK